MSVANEEMYFEVALVEMMTYVARLEKKGSCLTGFYL
jgi:hypothetical protein